MNKPVKCPKDTCIFQGFNVDTNEFCCTLTDDDDITCATHTQLVKEQYGPQSYRDELVEMIKACGQELIDRAEEMVAEDAKYLTDFNISICLPQPMEDRLPTMEWSVGTIATKAVEVVTRKNG